MNEENQDYQEENAEPEDYDDADDYEYSPSYPRINWPFTILSTIILQAGALGALHGNFYLVVGATVLAAVCASVVTWKETINDTTFTPHPNKFKIFFIFLTVVGVALSVLIAMRIITPK